MNRALAIAASVSIMAVAAAAMACDDDDGRFPVPPTPGPDPVETILAQLDKFDSPTNGSPSVFERTPIVIEVDARLEELLRSLPTPVPTFLADGYEEADSVAGWRVLRHRGVATPRIHIEKSAAGAVVSYTVLSDVDGRASIAQHPSAVPRYQVSTEIFSNNLFVQAPAAVDRRDVGSFAVTFLIRHGDVEATFETGEATTDGDPIMAIVSGRDPYEVERFIAELTFRDPY